MQKDTLSQEEKNKDDFLEYEEKRVRPSPAAVLAAIAEAFPAYPLDPTGVFKEWGIGYLDVPKFTEQSKGRLWTELTPKFLEYFGDAANFLGSQGYAQYLPAYLSAAVAFPPEIDCLPYSLLSSLQPMPENPYVEQRLWLRRARLTEKQQIAVAQALEYLVQAFSDSSIGEMAKSALDGFWRDRLPKK